MVLITKWNFKCASPQLLPNSRSIIQKENYLVGRQKSGLRQRKFHMSHVRGNHVWIYETMSPELGIPAKFLRAMCRKELVSC